MKPIVYCLALIQLFVLPARAADFSNWAAVIVAGDNHAHSGAPSEVFDNARRDLDSAFVDLGFSTKNIIQFSVQPEKYSAEPLLSSQAQAVGEALKEVAQQATSGCLLYFTSHGAPQGILVGQELLAPSSLAQMVGDACGTRPTIIVLSACYSGVFVLDLMGDHRLVLTAARRDRPSFGCGESNRYTFFDECFLQSISSAGNFKKLGDETRTCVAAREKKEGVDLPSEPQFIVGYDVMAELPTWSASQFARDGATPDLPVRTPSSPRQSAQPVSPRMDRAGP